MLVVVGGNYFEIFLGNNLLEHGFICTTKYTQYVAFRRSGVMHIVATDSQANVLTSTHELL